MLIEPQKLTALHDLIDKAHNASTHNFPSETTNFLIQLIPLAATLVLEIYEAYQSGDLKATPNHAP